MKTVTIALCDTNDAYRERLAEYIIRKKASKIMVDTFSGKRVYLEQFKKKRYDIVLLGTGFKEMLPEQEDGSLYLLLEEEDNGRERGIFKYQSAEEIVRLVFEQYLELGKEDCTTDNNQKEVIGIYSPTGSRVRTPFALAMAQIYAEEKRVLYLNFSEWPGLGYWLEREYKRDLSDLLYLISGYGSQVQGILECVIHCVGRVDYVPPMADAQLLNETSAEDFMGLLNLVTQRSGYEVIVMDFGNTIPGCFDMLERCTGIYGILDGDERAKAQCRQFEESLVKGNYAKIIEKMQFVTFSIEEQLRLEQDVAIHQWCYGILGDRVRLARMELNERN